MPHQMLSTQQKFFAKKLRHDLTDAERILWRALRGPPFVFYKFRRQCPIGIYITDFLSHTAKLVIELDGGQHNEESQCSKDAERDEWFEGQGYKVLRFWNNEVGNNLEVVLEAILQALPLTQSSPARGEGSRRSS